MLEPCSHDDRAHLHVIGRGAIANLDAETARFPLAPHHLTARHHGHIGVVRDRLDQIANHILCFAKMVGQFGVVLFIGPSTQPVPLFHQDGFVAQIPDRAGGFHTSRATTNDEYGLACHCPLLDAWYVVRRA